MFERSGNPAYSAALKDNSAGKKTRFLALWARCVADESSSAEIAFARLVDLYGEPHRHYHTLNHIQHCLGEFDQAAALMNDPDAVEMALWFHDAIYQPGASDNEWRSAELFRQWSAGRITTTFQQQVHDLVMATTHREPPDEGDAQFVVDIDLSSFGLPWEACERDGNLIRAEFPEVADDEYYPVHLRFLQILRGRPTFFFTEWFQQRYESVARENVARIIEGLRVRGFD
jgi:predicted metal-dependent HD superfamily phosphohydrolase